MEEVAHHKMTILAISGLMLFPQGEKRGYLGAYMGMRAYVEAGHTVHFMTCRPPLEPYEGDCARAQPNRLVDGIHLHEFYVPFLGWLSKLRHIHFPENRILHYLVYFIWIVLCQYLTWALFTLCATLAALRLAARIKPQVVYSFHIGNVAAWIVGRWWGVPVIGRLFGTFLYPLLKTPLYKWRYFTSVLGFVTPCDYLIVLDDGTHGDKVAGVLKVPPERIKFWRDGIHPSLLEPPKEPLEVHSLCGIPAEHKIVLMLGRLWLVKGFHKLIRVVPKIVGLTSKVTFLIVGDGGERGYLEDLARELGVGNWVKFSGSIPHEQVKSYLYAADLFVQLCDISNLTNVMLEALSSGRCVVTLDDGSLKDLIIHGESGFLVPPGDEETLASTVIHLLADEKLRLSVGKQAAHRVVRQLLTWPKRNQLEIDLIENLVYNSKRSP